MRPYPEHLVQRLKLADGSVLTVRPIRPDDVEIEREFVRGLSDETRYFRFMDSVRELTPKMLAHFTQVDYDRHLALVAVTEQDGREIEAGVARFVADDQRERCEFSIVVGDRWQRLGLGKHLMRALMAAARDAGVRVMHGDVLAGNARMLKFAAKLGFRASFDEQDPRVVRVEIDL